MDAWRLGKRTAFEVRILTEPEGVLKQAACCRHLAELEVLAGAECVLSRHTVQRALKLGSRDSALAVDAAYFEHRSPPLRFGPGQRDDTGQHLFGGVGAFGQRHKVCRRALGIHEYSFRWRGEVVKQAAKCPAPVLHGDSPFRRRLLRMLSCRYRGDISNSPALA